MKYSVINIYGAHPVGLYEPKKEKGLENELRQRRIIKRRKFAAFLSCVLLLSGCASFSDKTLPLAPQPPDMSQIDASSDFPINSDPSYSMMSDTVASAVAADIIPAASGTLALSETPVLPSYCRVKDRFDRKAAIAYEWDRSRLALDVDGMGLDGNVDALRVEYKLRIQPEKGRKAACRYKSAWQGVLGSGYNELFLRQEDTVWEETKKLKQKADPYLKIFY